jgi:predicted nucleic acid-binding protein
LNYVLDACALIAYLAEEKGSGYEAVAELFNRMEEDDTNLYMSVFNLIEVYYNFIKAYQAVEPAEEIMRQVDELPVEIIETVSSAVYRETARLKGFYRISLADAVACATAKSLGAAIVTKDGEIKVAEQGENLSVLWTC